MSRWRAVVVLGLVLSAAGVLGLCQAGRGLRSEHTSAGGVPVEVVRAAGGAPGRPAVVVAHGYAGSGRLMRPFADTLARRGFVVALPDLAGHARNGRPLSGPGEVDAELAAVVRYVRSRADVDPARVVLLGHSMGAAAVVRAGAADQSIAATVAISLGDDGAPVRPGPRHLLLIVGGLEPVGIRDATSKALAAHPDGRRMVRVPLVEHAGVLFADRTHREAAHWFEDVLGHRPERHVLAAKDRVAPAGLLLAGLLLVVAGVLVRPRGTRPPTVPALPRGADLWWLAGAVLAAPVAGLAGGALASRTLPSSVSGYLVGYAAGAGAVLAAVACRRISVAPPRPAALVTCAGFMVAGTAAVVVPVQAGLTSVVPYGSHAWLVALLALAVALLLGGAHAAAGPPYSVVVLALVSAPLPVAAAAGLAPGFLALVAPLMAALAALHLLLGGLAWRSGTPWWATVPAGALMVAWPVAASLPID
ncbi:alpha/beta hydrolase [Nucisporomicrobium flavum]|uniref:alpha/beta hydrolase n=1 Tax=Nucisporomicrobium flavum TaxID=2785915 RepID=UPI0018F67A88|nr:alpha/beta fold hydrolase [Nucisporomicrobium flavum]